MSCKVSLGRPRKISDAKIARMHVMRKQNMPLKVIASELGVSVASVGRLLKE
jgi:hypothetical protein